MPLDIQVFDQQMQDLKGAYKPWDYPIAREKKILEVVKNLSEVEFKAIVGELMMSEKAPLPQDFVVLIERNRKARARQVATKPARKNDCPHCFETGLMLVSEAGCHATHLIRCECLFGCNLQETYHLPQWNRGLSQNYEIKEFPADFFKPSESGLATPANVLQRWTYWIERVRLSEMFWDHNKRGA